MIPFQNNAVGEREDLTMSREEPINADLKDPGPRSPLSQGNTQNKDSQATESQATEIPSQDSSASKSKAESPKEIPKEHPKEHPGDLPMEPDFQKPADQGGGVVSFVMFNRKYSVKTDKPELIFELARMIHDQVREVRLEKSPPPIYDLDVLVQASFHMALKLLKALGGVRSLEENIETRDRKVLDLIDSIEKNLP
jgi:cell division protein ZapA (FtsZ GTPase activity inhibitor)